MVVRFLEFVKYNEEDVSLYFMEVNDDVSQKGFYVQIRMPGSIAEILCTEVNNNWQITTQNIPIWVRQIGSLVVKKIEDRIKIDK